MKINIKLLIGFIYLLCFIVLMLFIFSKFQLQELTNLNFVKNYQQIINNFKSNNETLLLTLFFIGGIIWVLMLGFASPLAIAAGFIFGKWTGTFVTLLSCSIGSITLYILANLFLKEFIKEKFSSKIEKFIKLFNKNEFLYFMLFRVTGGPGVPFAIQNLLPVIFNMKIKNYFFATLLGLLPGVFILSSIGSGLDKFINKNDEIQWSQLLFDPEIYLPLIGFVMIIFASIAIKKIFFNKKSYEK